MLHPVEFIVNVDYIYYQLKVLRCLFNHPWKGYSESSDTTWSPVVTPGYTVEPATLGGVALPGVQQR